MEADPFLWRNVVRSAFEPILAKGSVCHTDGAKAYQWLSSPLNDGTLVDAAGLKLSHTCVKHKPPHPEFSKKMRVQVWVGDHYEELNFASMNTRHAEIRVWS